MHIEISSIVATYVSAWNSPSTITLVSVSSSCIAIVIMTATLGFSFPKWSRQHVHDVYIVVLKAEKKAKTRHNAKKQANMKHVNIQYTKGKQDLVQLQS